MSKRVITMGKWNDKPVEWYVIQEDESMMLLFAKDVLEYGIKFNKNNQGNS